MGRAAMLPQTVTTGIWAFMGQSVGTNRSSCWSCSYRHSIDSSRSVSYSGFSDSLGADYHARTLQAFGELGYRIDTTVAAFEPLRISHMYAFTLMASQRGWSGCTYCRWQQYKHNIHHAWYACIGTTSTRWCQREP
ncbi:hypothetical protein DEA98_25990 [Brucella pseudogrignonensis]|nr:hypothetical protein [Brucella pseudogrignonensis]